MKFKATLALQKMERLADAEQVDLLFGGNDDKGYLRVLRFHAPITAISALRIGELLDLEFEFEPGAKDSTKDAYPVDTQ